MLVTAASLALTPVAVASLLPTSDPFFIFFDLGSAHLGARQQTILGNLEGVIRATNINRLEIVGHADRSGSAAYNLRLSRRRAEAVRAALIARGVPSSAIKVGWVGESALLVPTRDGVAEPQNRFVSVMIH